MTLQGEGGRGIFDDLVTFVNILHSEVLDLQTMSEQHRHLFVVYQGFILLCVKTIVSMFRDSMPDHRSQFPFYSVFL